MKQPEEHIEQPNKCSSNSNSNIALKCIPNQQQPQHQQSKKHNSYLQLVRKNILQITSISPGKMPSFNLSMCVFFYIPIPEPINS